MQHRECNPPLVQMRNKSNGSEHVPFPANTPVLSFSGRIPFVQFPIRRFSSVGILFLVQHFLRTIEDNSKQGYDGSRRLNGKVQRYGGEAEGSGLAVCSLVADGRHLCRLCHRADAGTVTDDYRQRRGTDDAGAKGGVYDGEQYKLC